MHTLQTHTLYACCYGKTILDDSRFNSLVSGRRGCITKSCYFETNLSDWYFEYFLWNLLQLNPIGRHWGWINICLVMISQLALRRWPNVGIGRHRRDRQPTSRQHWYSVACIATVCRHSVGARRLAYHSLPMFCVWTSVVGNQVFLE